MGCVQCSGCGKPVSNETGVDVVVRAFVECPECIEKRNFEIDKLTQIMRFVASNTRDKWARDYLVGRLDDRGHDSVLNNPVVVDADREELQIEVERLKAWLGKIGHEAWKDAPMARIEEYAETSIKHSSCVCHPNWEPCENWAPLGVWPPRCGK